MLHAMHRICPLQRALRQLFFALVSGCDARVPRLCQFACRKLFDGLIARCPQLGSTVLLPGIVQHTRASRSGHMEADGIALLHTYLLSCSSKVCVPYPSSMCLFSFWLEMLQCITPPDACKNSNAYAEITSKPVWRAVLQYI